MDEGLFSLQLPHSLEGEQAVLGSMLIDTQCIPRVIEKLRCEDFYITQNQEIFAAILAMFSFSEPIDPVTILNKLRYHGQTDQAATRSYLAQLMEVTPTSANVMEYLAIVKDRSLLRQIAMVSAEMDAMVKGGTDEAAHVLELAEQRIFSLRKGRTIQGLTHVSQVVLDVLAHLELLSESGSDIPGLSTGLKDVDRAISGLNDSDLILLAARPGMGKTSFALNVLLEAGKHTGKSVVFFSLEMSREQLATRLLSNEAFVDNKKLVTGRLSEDDWDKLALATLSLNQSNILIDDNPSLSVADMNAICRREENLGLVIIDYLQLMTSATGRGKGGENRQQVVSDISRSLKIMAKELNVPVMCLSQLSRGPESRTDKRPMLSDLRESGAIEQDADIVMFLYRDDYYNPDTEDRNIAECLIAKNRHGETGKVDLSWIPEYTTFASLDRIHEEY